MREVANWIVANLETILLIIVAVMFVGYGIQTRKIKEWLRYAVSVAEKDLGSGTGQLKLRAVYDMMLSKFPILSKFISFDTFMLWVDEALLWLDEQLAKNPKIRNTIEGDGGNNVDGN